MGVSLENAGKMFNKTPQEIRQIEAKELAKFKQNPTDDVILDFRERGLSLDQVAKMTGLENAEVRKREQTAMRNRPEIPPPDRDLSDEELSQWGKDRGGLSSRGRDDAEYARELAKQREKDKARGANATNPVGPQKPSGESGLSSTSKPSKPLSASTIRNIETNGIDDAIEELAAKDIGLSLSRYRELRDRGGLPERYEKAFTDRVQVLNEIFRGLSKEKLDKSPGTVISEIRKKLVDSLSSERNESSFIQGFEDKKELQNFIDGIENIVGLAFDDYVDRARENGTGQKADDLQADLMEDFTESLQKISKQSKKLFDERKISVRGVDAKKAKEESKSEKERLFDLLKNPIDMDSLADYLDSTDGVVPTDAFLDRIRKGNIDDEDLTQLNGFLEDALENIISLDPSLDPEKLAKEFSDAFRESAKNDDSGVIQRIAKELGDDGVSEDLVQYLKNGKDSSPFLPDRGKNEREVLRGLSSRSGTPKTFEQLAEEADPRNRPDDLADFMVDRMGLEEDNPMIRNLRDEARGGSEDGAWEKAREYIAQVDDEEASGLSSRGAGTMLGRPGQIQRDENGKINSPDAANMRKEYDAKVFSKLRDLGFSDDEIESLTGVPNGGREHPASETVGLSSRSIRPDSGVKKYSIQLLQQKRDSLDDSPSVGVDRKQLDGAWADQVIADLNEGKVDPVDMMGVMQVAMDDINEQLKSPEKNTGVIDERQKLGKKIRRLLVNNMSDDEKSTSGKFASSTSPGGLSSRNSRGSSNLPYGSGYSANLSEDEISQLKEDLKDIDGVQDIVKRLNEASPSQAMDSQRIRMTPEEIDKWLKDIQTAREGMPGVEGNVLGDIEDILTRAKKDVNNNFTSPSISRRTRPLTTETGTINAHPKLDIELSQDEIGLLREEIKGLIKGADKPEALLALDETLSKASNGKFSVSAEQYDSLIPSIEEAKKKNNMVTSDLLGLLSDVADSKDGKYSSIEIAKTGAEGGIGKPKRLNSGAPADITAARQREIIDWARKQKGLRIAQKNVSDFDKNNGELSSSQWRALETLHTNLGPVGGLRSSSEDGAKPRSSRPGSSARGIGDVTRGETSRGRQMGGEQLGERDKGEAFDDLKPENWEDLDNDEKLDWLLYEGSPAKSGMKPIDHERVMKELFAEEEKINARKDRDSRRASRPADWVPPKVESKPLDEAKPAKKRPTTKEAASKQRDGELTNLVDFVSSSASRVDSAKQTDDIEAAHEDIWSELDDVLSGSEDLTRSNISAMIDSLNTYIDDYSGNTNNSEEGKNVTRAKKLLKTLEDLDVYYEDDTFISDGDAVGNERPSFGVGGMDSRSSGLSSFGIRRNKPEESKTPRVVKPKKKLVTDNWKKVGGQGGSQPGGKFADENGKEFYVKEPKTLLHAENESLVSKLYAALGVKAADVEVGEHKGKPKIVSEWVPGAQTGIMGTKRNDAEWRKKVQSGFVADAWLANWDALGNSENIAIGGDGEAYRVDTGGGILFRARGAEKGSQFGNTVGEMESLRNPSVNSLGASYYGDITPEQVAAQVKTVGALSDSDIRDMVSASISDPAQAKKISDTLIARRDDLVKNWSTGVKGGRGGMSSRSDRIGKSPSALDAEAAALKDSPEIIKLRKTIDEYKKASEAKYGKPGVVERTSGLRSSSGKPGRTMITDEATYFGQIESSLPKEIEAARKANDKATVEGLQKLLDLIKKQEASKTGSRRTNVGSVYATRDEVDQILDAMMTALDRQISRGEGKGDERAKLYSKLIDMLAAAGMSTFIDKDTNEIGSRTTNRTNSQGRNISIPNT